MSEEIKKYLFDIRISIEAINEYLGEKRDFSAYLKNRLVQRAVERELEIIGVAMKRMLVLDPTIPITNAKKIIGARNIVAHEYDNVQDEILWSVVVNHLPLLLKEVNELYNS